MHHDLKIVEPFYGLVASGEKNFEVRRNDRAYQKGDTATLRLWKSFDSTSWMLGKHREYSEDGYHLTKPPIEIEIMYVLTGEEWGVKDGYAVLGFKKTNDRPAMNGMIWRIIH